MLEKKQTLQCLIDVKVRVHQAACVVDVLTYIPLDVIPHGTVVKNRFKMHVVF